MSDLPRTGVVLTAEQSAEFLRAMDGAQKSVANFGKQAGSAASGGIAAFKKSWTELSSAFAMGERALGYVQKAFQATVGETIKFGQSVEDMSRMIGSSAEESSRLITVTDMLGMSQGSLATAMEAAIRKGVSPTIEGLGKISDQYLAIQDPIARTKFLMDTFGRSGADMGELMEKGSKGIARLGDQAERTGLVMSQQDVEGAKALGIQLNLLELQAKGVGIALGKIVMPVLAPAIGEYLGLVQAVADGTATWEQATTAMILYAAGNRGVLDMILQTDAAFRKATEGITVWTDDATSEVEKIRAGLALPLPPLTLNGDIKPDARTIMDLFGWGEGGQKKQVFTGGVVATLTTPELPQTFQDVRSLAGTPVAMTVDTKRAQTDLLALKAQIDAIKSKTEIVTIIHKDIYESGTGGGRQGGGPVEAFTRYIVGERGREMFIPPVNGTILDHADTERLMRAMAHPATVAPAMGASAIANSWDYSNNSRSVNIGSVNPQSGLAMQAFDGLLRTWLGQ